MSTPIKSEAERARTQYASLVKHYRPVGPAAVAAALVCMRKPRKNSAQKAA